MSSPIDLELSIRHIENDSYIVNVRFEPIGSQVGADVEGRVKVEQLEPSIFLAKVQDPEAYGIQLGEALWSSAIINETVNTAFQLALEKELRLRFRLSIAPRLVKLHSLLWETIRHPRIGILSANEHIQFSRYLPAQSYQPIQPRPHTELRALVFAANPAELTDEQYQLPAIDVEKEVAQARAGLGNIPITAKVKSGEGSFKQLLAGIREDYDIVYIVAHGKFSDSYGDGSILLEDDTDPNKVDVIYGQRLVESIKALSSRPSLVILASCESAGSGEQSQGSNYPLSALGPALSSAGIPAVIAMNGQVSMETITQLMQPFFKELIATGEVDQALSLARTRLLLEERADWWMPVLYMTLKHGRIGWYTPDFGEGADTEVTWQGLQTSIQRSKCTPIIGMGPIESWFGSRQAMAKEWAKKKGFPLGESSAGNLSEVALYWAIKERSSDTPRYGYIQHFYDTIWQRYGHSLPESMSRRKQDEPADPSDLNELMLEIWRRYRAVKNSDPYTILAELDLPIYLLADPSDLLFEALKAQGKTPQVRMVPWNPDAKETNDEYIDADPLERPSKERPLLYYLFGRMAVPETLVITEDDYFDFLIQFTATKPEIPKRITSDLSKNALVFLGFRFHDWQFRTFLRILKNQEVEIHPSQPHIAAQLEPNEQTILQPEEARDYLRRYLKQQHFEIFWGRSIDFLNGYQAFVSGVK